MLNQESGGKLVGLRLTNWTTNQTTNKINRLVDNINNDRHVLIPDGPTSGIFKQDFHILQNILQKT